MSKCPHCGAPANPLRLSVLRTSASYSCVSCKKKSRFDRDTRAAIGGVAAFGAIAIQSIFQFERGSFVIAVVSGTLTALAAMHFLLKLHPAED